MLKGKIVKNISNIYTVYSSNHFYDCKARGKFRNMKLTPLVGDEVEFDEKNLYILNILPRKNELDRPNISNIDICLIVTSLKEPDLSLFLLDKEICSIFLAHVIPVICFTKLDLASSEELKEMKQIRKYYESIGIRTFTNLELEELEKHLKNKYVVLTGQTGAGKSSLINKMDSSFHLEIGEISASLGRGRHTTRHTEFYFVHDIYIADTPGFSSLDITKYTKEEIRDTFPEFQNKNCEYRDCMHLKEPSCEVKDFLSHGKILKSRYEHYCQFIGELNI